MLRILALVPLLAAGVDLTRAQVLCGTSAQTCLEAAGRGWMGPLAVVLVLAYGLAAGVWLTRRSRPVTPAPFARTWALSTATLVTVLNAQQATTGVLTPGGFLGTLVLCVAAGALLALALRALDRFADLVPRAVRALPKPVARILGLTPPPEPVYVTVDGTLRGRAPPSA